MTHTPTLEIRVTTDSPTGSNFHLYLDGYYHVSCASEAEARQISITRFGAAAALSKVQA